MGYASKVGRARTNSRTPEASGICDRCSFRYNHSDLNWQMAWAGNGITNLRILVCDRCNDGLQDQDRAIIIPPDPVPIQNPRPEFFQFAETDYLTLTPKTIDPVTGIAIPNTTEMTTVAGSPMTKQPIGKPKGYTLDAQMPLVAGKPYAVKLPVISLYSSGGVSILATTLTEHGLSTNNQVGVAGVTSSGAAGVYSITVTSPTQFTYQASATVPAGSVLTANTRVITMNMGLPRGYVQVPQTS